MVSSVRVCISCVLPETFPRVRFNKEGVCNYCLEYKKRADNEEREKAEYKRKFDSLIRENKGKGSYDVMMCYSGGKDSTYTMTILKEKYDLNILSLTLDNGFVSKQTYENINKVVEKLGIDHIFFKPRFDILSKIFSECANKNIYPVKTLERASTICTSCMAVVKFTALRLAIEKNVPFLAYGWSPGQAPITSSIMKNNPQMVRMMQKALFDPLFKLVGDNIRPYFLENKHFEDTKNFPYNIHPLAFLEYSEDKIQQKMVHLGWKAPQDVDANSTNCLLNSFANVIHKERLGFHPYSFELANLVRGGYLSRTIALKRLLQNENPRIVKMVREKLAA